MKLRLSDRTTPVGIILFIVGALLIFAKWDAIKEQYFNVTLGSCRGWHGVPNVRWQEIPAFDGKVRRVIADSETEQAMVRCTTRWAGPIIERFASPTDLPWPKGALEVSIGGYMFNPPQLTFDAAVLSV